MAVDLHTHSNRSDGSETPAEVVRLAAAAGLTTVALTDHDTLDGIPQARAAAAGAGVRLISGTELSVQWETGAMHLLAYFLDPGAGPLQDAMAGIREGRSDRNRRLAAALARLGMDVDYDEVAAEAGGTGVGRPHFAAVMVRKGYAADIPDAFDRYLARGRPAYQERDRLEASKAIDLARASGAVPVVAHPHTIGVGADDYATAFSALARVGLGGIEAHYAEYPPDLRLHLAGLAADLGMVATGGSDFHGTYKPEIRIGSGRGDLVVPDECVERLDEAQSALP